MKRYKIILDRIPLDQRAKLIAWIVNHPKLIIQTYSDKRGNALTMRVAKLQLSKEQFENIALNTNIKAITLL